MSAYTSLLIYQLKELLPFNIFYGKRDPLHSHIANSKHLCIYAMICQVSAIKKQNKTKQNKNKTKQN